MKQFGLLLITLCIITISACRKDLDTKCKSYTRVNVFNVIGENEFHLDSTYINNAGEAYNAYMLKYYISHMKLVNENGDRVELYGHELIDHSIPASMQLDQVEIPDGHYTSLEFNLGVDSLHNHSGDQAGDLDPMYGMIWTWNTGYIFFKHEGYFISSTSGTEQPLIYHYGTDRALAPISLPIELHVDRNSSVINIQFDLNKLYSNPNTIAFTGNNNRQSLSAADIPWINALRANFPNAFSASAFVFLQE